MTETADVVVVGAGVQGASLAFHLAERGARVAVVERGAIASGATGRSSGFVRMHYDFRPDAELAWASFPYFRDWADRVGAGECGFTRTGFVQLVPAEQEPVLRANVAMLRGLGVDTRVIDRAEFEGLLPGVAASDVSAAAYEPQSGYADPSGTAAGFLAAARARGATVQAQCRVNEVTVDGGRVTGVRTDRGMIAAPVVAIAAGAWTADVARTAGVDVPVVPWRHDTAYFGLPEGRSATFPIVLDNASECYFRPEGRDMMLVGLEIENEIGGSPDRPELPVVPQRIVDVMIARVIARVPWMTAGTFRTAHGGQDGITPDQRPIIGPAGPQGLFLSCGFSGTGFKTAPAIGAALAERILDGGKATTVDISPFDFGRFAAGRPIVGDNPYGAIWR